MTADSPASCPDEASLVGLLEERLAGRDQAAIAAHVSGCPACSATLAGLAGRWSLAPLARDADRAAGSETLAVAAAVAARPPALSAAEAGQAAIPRGVPTIPGLVDLAEIGRGGMGVVYRAREPRLDRDVAVKVLWSFGPLSAVARARAERESLMLARLSHPHVVTIHGTGETAEGVPYLVMEWVAGQSLQQRIDEGTLTPRLAARIVRDLARALGEVHALGIVHRDLKPDNILLARGATATEPVPKLADFGLARPDDAALHLTQPDAVAGTPAFMAAEQTGLDPAVGEVGPATDVHGLGGILYAALVGRPPYDGKTPGESMRLAVRGAPAAPTVLAARCPADLRTIIEKCLRADPVHRYRSAGDLADDLDRFLAGLPVLARPLPWPARAGRWVRRQPLAATALGVALAMTLFGIVSAGYTIVSLRGANRAITQSRDAATVSNEVARRSLTRLTDAAVRRLLVRGQPLNDEDRAFLETVREEYAAWPLAPDPQAMLRFRADGLTRLANLFRDLDHYAEALETQQSLIATLAALDRVTAEPRDTSPQSDPEPRPSLERLGAMRLERNLIARVSGPAAAEAATREALALIDAGGDHDLAHSRELAAVLLEHGWHLHLLDRVAEAETALERAIALVETLRTRAPDDAEVMRLEMATLLNAGICYGNLGKVAEREALMRRLVASTSATLARLGDVPPDVPKGMSLGLAYLAEREAARGNRPEALALMTRRLDLCRERHARDPGNVQLRTELIDALLVISGGHDDAGRAGAAEAAVAEAVAVAEQAVEDEPAVFEHARNLARVFGHQALRVGPRSPADAVPLLERQLAVLGPWRDLGGREAEVRSQMAEAERLLAEIGERSAAEPAPGPAVVGD
jgi:tetratricopeptide (TPR) repeat protein